MIRRLGISQHSEVSLKLLFRKLGATNRTELFRKGVRQHPIEL
jgi:DNA-binding CsgD family transcriptional regulator